MNNIKCAIGQKFNRLTILEINGDFAHCKCDCGNVCDVRIGHIITGHTQSCGCLQKERCSTINGLYKTRLHKIWDSMHARCECEKHESYKLYKDKKICDEWHKRPRKQKQIGFLNFYNWAIEHGYRDDLSLDRIDNNKGYSPDNCRWVTLKEQARNMTTNVNVEYNGKIQCLKAWCEELNISYNAVIHCVARYGLTYPEAFDRYLYTRWNPHTQSWEPK